MLVGLGVGSYGSRVASSRAVGVLHKDEYRLPAVIPPFTSAPYRANVGDLYTAADARPFTGSNVIMNPFAGVVGVIAELGILGSCLYMLVYLTVFTTAVRVIRDDGSVMWRALAGTAVFAIPFLILLNVFDAYFSQPSVTIPVWYLLSCVYARDRMLRRGRGQTVGEEVATAAAVT